MKTNLGPKGTIKMLVGGAGGARRRRRCIPVAVRGGRGSRPTHAPTVAKPLQTSS